MAAFFCLHSIQPAGYWRDLPAAASLPFLQQAYYQINKLLLPVCLNLCYDCVFDIFVNIVFIINCLP